MNIGAFMPLGNTALLAVTSTTTTTPIQVLPTNGQPSQHCVYNAGPNDCYIVSGNSTVAAVAPAAGTPGNGMPIAAGAIMTLTFPAYNYFAAITDSGNTASLYITPGEGN
jgi:Flp pilus assembly protein TadG